MKSKLSGGLGHYLLPEIAVIFSFLSYAFHPGSIGDLMRICGGIVLANLIIRNYRLNSPSLLPIYLILGFLIIWSVNLFAPADMVHHRSFRYFLAFPGMVLAVYYLILIKAEQNSRFSLRLYACLFIAAIAFQLLLVGLSQNSESLGIYGNLHRLGLFSCITIPVIVYMAAVSKKALWRSLLLMAVIFDLILLFSSNSRVSWMAFLAGSILTILIFFKGWKKLLAILGLFFSLLFAGMLFKLSRIIESANHFIAHIKNESRWTIWSNTINLLKDNSVFEWFVGHGIGSFRYYFQDYSTYMLSGSKIKTSFPHNGFLQVLFENGIIGFFLIFGGLGLLMISFFKAYHSCISKQIKFFFITIFAVFWIDFGCFIVNEPFYSKYIQYSFAVIIGIMMALISQSKQLDSADTREKTL